MKFDLSFIPSYECNLNCWFCMYDCGPNKKEKLSIFKASRFLKQIDYGKINWIGFYGGEISINMPLYQKFINLVPLLIQKFTITNGSWSTNNRLSYSFVKFILKNKIKTLVSCTPEHKKHQNEKRLKILNKNDIIHIKKNDDTKFRLLPMGRLSNEEFSCNLRCTIVKDLVRIAMRPDGNIIFQNCDGIYPVVGDCTKTLDEIENNIKNLIRKKRQWKKI